MQVEFVSIVFALGACFQYCHPAAWSTNDTITRTIIADIRKAFSEVTNKTSLLNRIIPKMYILNVTDPPFIFKLPQRDGAVVLVKRRGDFLDPQFPNLTTSYMDLMKGHRHIKVYSDEDDEWGKLGLEGWSGDISRVAQVSQLDEMTGQHMEESNYNGKIFGNLEVEPELLRSIKMRERSSSNTVILGDTTITASTGTVAKHEDSIEVYLARVNDPFGYSTIWEFRIFSESPNIKLTVTDSRPKRDVVRLYSMIKCSTSCEPLVFKGYGCFCGFLGSGLPVDGIDRCCKLHDKCYEQSNCISYLEYFVPYIWKCYRGKPLCAIDHGEWGGPRSCAARLCHCDVRLSRCLRQFACPSHRAMCKSSALRKLQTFLFP